MTPSYYTARANLSYLLEHHPEWTNAQFAVALGYSRGWVKKWRARLQEEHAAGIAVETSWQGHSLKHYYISSHLVGHRVVLQLDAPNHCLHVFFEQQPIKEVPLRGLVGHPLSFEQFLEHMRHQARAQARLRSLQERHYRTAP